MQQQTIQQQIEAFTVKELRVIAQRWDISLKGTLKADIVRAVADQVTQPSNILRTYHGLGADEQQALTLLALHGRLASQELDSATVTITEDLTVRIPLAILSQQSAAINSFAHWISTAGQYVEYRITPDAVAAHLGQGGHASEMNVQSLARYSDMGRVQLHP